MTFRVVGAGMTLCPRCARTHADTAACLVGVLLVCGGRDYADFRTLSDTLDRLALRMAITAVRHGAARGADALADRWARSRRITVEPMAADWRMGKAGGPIRNAAMLARTPHPVCCVAFTPGPSGTRGMVALCEAVPIPVWRVGWPQFPSTPAPE